MTSRFITPPELEFGAGSGFRQRPRTRSGINQPRYGKPRWRRLWLPSDAIPSMQTATSTLAAPCPRMQTAAAQDPRPRDRGQHHAAASRPVTPPTSPDTASPICDGVPRALLQERQQGGARRELAGRAFRLWNDLRSVSRSTSSRPTRPPRCIGSSSFRT
jgi:hypothetical protein